MEAWVSTSVIVAVVLIIAAAAAPALALAWRRVMAHQGGLRLWQAMRRRDLAPQDAAAAGKEYSLGIAARRCVMCSSVEECDAWLASGEREGAEHFCPNTTFLENLERDKKRAQR